MSNEKKVDFSALPSTNFSGFSLSDTISKKSKVNNAVKPVKVPVKVTTHQVEPEHNLVDENIESESDVIITPETPLLEKTKIAKSVGNTVATEQVSKKMTAASRYLMGGFAYLENQLGVIEFNDKSQFELLQEEVRQTYGLSRVALYDALALAFCWYNITKKDKKCLSSAFGGDLPEDTNSAHRSAIRACFGLSKKYKSKVTQYGQTLDYLEHHCDKSKLLNPTDETVLYLSNLIADCGGVSKCIKKLKEETQVDKTVEKNVNKDKTSSKPTINEQADSLVKAWQTSIDIKKEFDYQENVELEENKIVILCGRMTSQKIEVLEVVSDDGLAKAFAKTLLKLNE